MTYKAFLSYSHAADGKLAPLLQSALHRFAKPFLRLRAMRVFRDATSLRLTPALWPTIQKALRESEHFILMASPAAAASEWVRMEVREWLTQPGNPRERLFIVLTEGKIVWDRAKNDFDWTQTNALPPELKGVFDAEPFHLDFSWAREAKKLGWRNANFLEGVGKLGAALHDRPLDELMGEDIKQHRLVRLLSGGAIVSLTVLSIVAVIAAVRAKAAAARAEKQTLIANEQRQTAEQRQVQLQQSYSDTEYHVGQQLLERGETANGVAHLARALETNPANQSAADRLYNLVAMRDQPILRRRFRFGAPVVSYDINPAGDTIVAVTAGSNPTVRTSNGASAAISLPSGTATHVRFLDGDTVLILADDGSVLRAPRSGGKASLIGRLPSAAALYALSPGGDSIAAACENHVIALLPLRQGATATTLPFEMQSDARAIGFVREGKALMVITGHAALELELASGQMERTEVEENYYPDEQVAAIAPNGTWLSTMLDPGGLEEESYVMAEIHVPEGSKADWDNLRYSDTSAGTVEFNAAGTMLAVTLGNDEVHLFRDSGGDVTLRHVFVDNSAPHPKRDIVYTGAGDGSVILWNAETGKPIAAPLWHEHGIESAKFAPDGDTLAVLTTTGEISLWDLSPHAPASSTPLRVASPNDDDVQRGTRYLLRRRKDNTDLDDTAIFELVDAQTKKLVRTYEYDIASALHDADRYHGSAKAAMSANDSVIVTIAGGSDPVIWSTAAAKPVAHFMGSGEARDVYVSPDGDRAVVVYEHAYGVYALPAGDKIGGDSLRPKQELEAVSPAFDRVIISEVGTAWVRDLTDNHAIGQPAHHDDQIRAARFSSDGRTYCTASRDGTLRVWDVASGYPLSEPLVFDPAPPYSNGRPLWEDDYYVSLGAPSIVGRRITFPDPADADHPREFAWDVSLPLDAAGAKRLAELATLVFGARMNAGGGVERVLAPEADELAAKFDGDAIAELARRAVSRGTSRPASLAP